MKKALIASILTLALVGCGTITTGNVGVKTCYGTIDPEPVQPGFYTTVCHVAEKTAKETSIELDGLRPRAKDNLFLKDLEVSIYFRVNAAKVPALEMKYSGQDITDDKNGVDIPAGSYVKRMSQSAIYDVAGMYDSLSINTHRDQVAADVFHKLQKSLDATDPGVFTITNVIVQAVTTDPAIEQANQQVVQKEKQLQAKQYELQIANSDAQIEVAKATGIATANAKIAASLTPMLIAHEKNEVMRQLATHGGTANFIEGNATPLIGVGK